MALATPFQSARNIASTFQGLRGVLPAGSVNGDQVRTGEADEG